MRGLPNYFAALVLGVSIGLAACGDGSSPVDPDGGAGGGGTGGGEALLPGQILPGVAVEGSLSSNETDEYFIDLELDTTYLVLGSGALEAYTIRFYDDAARTHLVGTCSSILLCDLALAAGRYYLSVTPSFGLTGEYSFRIIPQVGEGTIDAPIVLPLNRTTALVVGALSNGYYRFDAPVSGAYDLLDEWTSSGALAISLYADASFAGTPIGTCDGGSFAPCRFSGILAGPVFVRVDVTADADVTFLMSPVHTLGEGAVTDEIAISSTPRAGAVDDWSKSYYSLTTTEAGSYVISLEGTTLTSAKFEAHLGSESAPIVSSCEGLSCALWALEPNTTYLILVDGAESGAYQISATRGVAVGAPLSPVPITPDVEVTGMLDPGASSYYEMTAPVSRYYVARPGFTEVWGYVDITWSTDGGVTTTTCRLYDDSVCDLGPILEGTSITYEVSSNLAAFAMTLGPEPFGEGIPAAPITLTADTDHVGTQGDAHPNHYRFTADGVGGDYELVVYAETTQFGVSAPFACYGNEYTRICKLPGVAPNQVIDFTTSIYNPTTMHAIALRISKSSVAIGCEPGSLACYDFESGAPADFTTSAQSFKVSAAAAIRGAQGYEGGTKWPSCFSFSVPAAARAVSYSVEFYSPGTYLSNYLDIDVDGQFAGGANPSDTIGVQRRLTVPLNVGAAHIVEFCYYSMTDGTYVYIDDIAVR